MKRCGSTWLQATRDQSGPRFVGQQPTFLTLVSEITCGRVRADNWATSPHPACAMLKAVEVLNYRPTYTLKDYEQWEGRWELWSGYPVAMSPSANREHQRVARKLSTFLTEALSKQDCQDCELFQEIDWRVGQDTVFRPDLLIVCNDQETDFIEKTPDFIAEILSESTRTVDLIHKKKAYQQLGVGFYLLVDPKKKTNELWELRQGEYCLFQLERFTLCEGCELPANFDHVFSSK